MPIQAPQWTEYLSCPVCANGFELNVRLPISLGCGHTICKTCLANLQRHQCPFDQCSITIPLAELPVNTALVLLIDSDSAATTASVAQLTANIQINDEGEKELYQESMFFMEKLSVLLRPSNSQQLSRPMQRKLVSLINCQPMEEEGRTRAVRAARSLGERSVTELILQHQNPQQLSANLWAAVRTRGCQFLGPAMQEEVLKLVLLALEDGSALSRKVLVMFVVQRLEPRFPQASKTSIGHVVQLLYRASCFKVTKRDGDSSLMQLKEEFRTYETLRREHDAQIVQIATEAGLRIAPDQWSSLLYGDSTHKSHMQSIIDKLQTPQSFLQSVQELVIALQRTGDPGKLSALRNDLDLLSGLDPNPESTSSDWKLLNQALEASEHVVLGLLAFMSLHNSSRRSGGGGSSGANSVASFSNASDRASVASSGGGGGGVVGDLANSGGPRYKTSLCRDFTAHGSCPRGKNCTFAHSVSEMDQFRGHGRPVGNANVRHVKLDGRPGGPLALAHGHGLRPPGIAAPHQPSPHTDRRVQHLSPMRVPPLMQQGTQAVVTPVAQVAPVPRSYGGHAPTAAAPPQAVMVRPQAAGPPTVAHLNGASLVVNNEMYPQAAELLAQGGPPCNPSAAVMHLHHQAAAGQAVIMQPHPHHPPQFVPHPHHAAALLQTAVMQPPPPHPPPPGMVQHQQSNLGPPPPAQQQMAVELQQQQQPQDYQQQIYFQTMEEVHLPKDIFDEDFKKNESFVSNKKVATKSLSALKSRKEEIIDSLQGIVGEEETKKISDRTCEIASNLQKIGVQAGPGSVCGEGDGQSGIPEQTASSYNPWTSRVFTPVFTTSKKDNSRLSSVDRCLSPCGGGVGDDDGVEGDPEGYEGEAGDPSDNPDFIPFTETPIVSRFGPISKIRGSADTLAMVRNCQTSQSQAVIDDETQMTHVVMNSKQMARPAPNIPPAVLNQNGALAQLQPVAVGMNGEIEYMVVPAETTPQQSIDLRAVHQASIHSPCPSQTPTPVALDVNGPTTAASASNGGNGLSHREGMLIAESQRMKHELKILQKKISNLNLAKMSNGPNAWETENGLLPTTGMGEKVKTDQLTKELQMIENTILDRESEIIFNHSAADDNTFVDHGSYVDQGMMQAGGITVAVISSANLTVPGITTTTVRSGDHSNGQYQSY